MKLHSLFWSNLWLVIVSGMFVLPPARSTAEEGKLNMLIDRLERESGENVGRGPDGTLVRLAVPLSFVNDTNLALIGECSNLKELALSFTTKDYVHLTRIGFDQLQRLPHLTKLKVSCPLYIPKESFASICRLTNLTWLSLVLAPPAGNAYFFLTNLVNLEELTIAGAENFGDAELSQLTTLPSLRVLIIGQTSVSDDWLKMIRQFPALTNVVVRNLNNESPPKMEMVTWSKYRR